MGPWKELRGLNGLAPTESWLGNLRMLKFELDRCEEMFGVLDGQAHVLMAREHVDLTALRDVTRLMCELADRMEAIACTMLTAPQGARH